MIKHFSYVSQSRGKWGVPVNTELDDLIQLDQLGAQAIEKLQLGCLQRIANALETIAKEMKKDKVKIKTRKRAK